MPHGGGDGPLGRPVTAPRFVAWFTARWHVCTAATLAAVLRLPTVFNGLPFVRHPDEPINYGVVHRMVAHHDALPRFYDYPSLAYDLQALTHAALTVVARATGAWTSPADTGVVSGNLGTNVAASHTAWIAARLVTVVVSTGGVVIVVGLATTVCASKAWGWFAGFLAACSGIGLSTGAVVTPDALAGTTAIGALAVLIATTSVADRAGSTRWLAATGAAVGLAIGAKYNNALLLPVGLLFCGEALRRHRQPLGRLLVLVGAAVVAFAATTPAVVLDVRTFADAVAGVYHHYSGGHPGAEGNSAVANARYLWRSDATAVLLTVIAVMTRPRGPVVVLGVWVVTYLLAISTPTVHFDRNLTPVLGAIAVLAAVGAQRLMARLCAPWPSRDRSLALAAMLPVGLTMMLGIGHTVETVHRQLTDYQAEARLWLDATIPPTATVAAEPYSPWVDQSEHAVTFVPFVGTLAEAALPDVDVVIVNSLGSGRFTADRSRYPQQSRRVDRLVTSACRVEHFDDGFGYRIDVVFTRCDGG